MRADKTLVAGAAAAIPKTLNMSKFYAGQAQIEIQQAGNIMKLFSTEKEVNNQLLKDIKKMTEDVGVYTGGEKAAGFFHGNLRENAANTTEENLDQMKFKSKKLKDFRDQIAVGHGELIDLFSNPQNINTDATYTGSLKNAKSYVNDEAIGFQDDKSGMYLLYSGISNDDEVLEVRPSDIKNYFGVVPIMSDEEKEQVFKILQKRKSKTFNKNDIKSSLYGFISTDRDIRVANLLTTPDLMDNTGGSIADEMKKEQVFDELFPEMANNTAEQKKDFVAQLTQPGHPKYDSNASAEFAVNYYANVLEQENVTFNIPENQLPEIGDRTVVSYRQFTTKNNYVNIAPTTPIALPQFNELLNNLRSGNEFMAPFGEDRVFSFDKQNKTWSYSEKIGDELKDPVTGLSLEQVKRLLNGGSETNAFDKGYGFMLNMEEFVNLEMDPSLMKQTENKSNKIEVEEPNFFDKLLRSFGRLK
tara:strand:- start:63 stop:1478 length:1416 start_codon:yes stop_codon:yes gene_type:complete